MKAPILITLALSCTLIAAPVTLTDNKGRSITVEITGVTKDTVQVVKGSANYEIPLASLDEASRAIVEAKRAEFTTGAVRVRLRAKTASTSRKEDEKWETEWGSYDRDIYRSRSVCVDLECTAGDEDGFLTIQWLGRDFILKAKEVDGVEVVKLPLRPEGEKRYWFAAIFVEKDEKYEALGLRERSGLKYVGWIVRVVKKDGTVVSEQASNPVHLTTPPLGADELAK